MECVKSLAKQKTEVSLLKSNISRKDTLYEAR